MRPPRGTSGGRPRPQETGKTRGPLSLARALSKFGVCSRKQAVLAIEAGRVRLNGAVVRVPARRIDPREDKVQFDGRSVGDDTERIVLALHKPTGYITSRHDPQGRPTVYDLTSGCGRWVFPVGRLDQDTSGLLILTNDHRLGQRLSDPAAHVPKTYHVLVTGAPPADALGALRGGIVLPDGTPTRPARVRLIGSPPAGRSWLEIVLTEGKNRQVRRMCAQVGLEVLSLMRVRIGDFGLGDLAVGQWRRLDPAEISRLATLAKAVARQKSAVE
jgi:23S rRNA pseudouridine2605 synthase